MSLAGRPNCAFLKSCGPASRSRPRADATVGPSTLKSSLRRHGRLGNGYTPGPEPHQPPARPRPGPPRARSAAAGSSSRGGRRRAGAMRDQESTHAHAHLPGTAFFGAATRPRGPTSRRRGGRWCGSGLAVAERTRTQLDPSSPLRRPLRGRSHVAAAVCVGLPGRPGLFGRRCRPRPD